MITRIRKHTRAFSKPACLILGFSLALSLCGCKKKEAGGSTETRVAIKTSLPSWADVSHARTLSFADLARLAQPPGVQKNDPRYETARIPGFDNPLGLKEGDVVSVRGYLHRAALMGDGDYNLRLTPSVDSAEGYIVVEIPDDDDVSDRNLRRMVDDARDFVKSRLLGGHDPERAGTSPANAPYVEIAGQLYFNDAHAGDTPQPDKQGTHRAGYWEIHPGLKVQLAPAPAP